MTSTATNSIFKRLHCHNFKNYPLIVCFFLRTGRTFYSFSEALAYSALNSDKIPLFILSTAQHENEAQSGNHSLRPVL